MCVCHISTLLFFCCAEELRWLVLDEADRLLDLGFEKKIAEVSWWALKRKIAEVGGCALKVRLQRLVGGL